MSLSRLQSLFTSKGFVPNIYFTLNGNYKFVEIVNFKSAVSLIVDVGTKYQVPAERVKHEYELLQKNVNSDILTGFTDEAEIRSSYREIDHISKALESEDKLQEIYDKQISLKGEETLSAEKFTGTIRQMKRFRLCVKNIPYKFALFDDDCVCVLNSETSEIETYYAVEYKHRKRRIFITTTLENFFNTDDIEQSIIKISEQFYNILQENQKIETGKIQSMIDSKNNVVTQSKRILEVKRKLLDKIKLLQTQHSALLDKLSDMARRQKELTKGDANSRLMSEKIRVDMEKIEEQQRDIVRNILDTRKELDEVCLVVDNILFDNMVMLSKIAYNFRVLERIKSN